MDVSDSDTDSYAGSAASIAVIQETSEVKLAEQIEKAFDPLPLDRALVVETRHSALINALNHDLIRLKQDAQGLCEESSLDHAKWLSLLKKTEANVDWLRTRVAQLASREKAAAPIEYEQANMSVAPGHEEG